MCSEQLDHPDDGRKVERRYSRLIEHLREGVAAINSEAVVLTANPAAERCFGVEPGRLVGHSLFEFINPAAWQATMEQARQGGPGVASQHELTLTRSDGELRVISVSIVPEQDSAGGYSDSKVLIQDITTARQTAAAMEELQRGLERQVMERTVALLESEARYKLLTSMTSDYAASVLVGDDGSLTTEWVGGSFEEITGYPIHFNQPARLESTHPDDIERQRQDIARTIQNHATISEFRTLRPDGKIVWLRVSRQPVWDEEQERVIRYMTMAQDITERKQAEEELRQHQLQKAELEGIRKTVATLAHEINNPLTGIIANLQMGIEPDLDIMELREMLEAALGAANTIREVVTKIQQIEEPAYRPYHADREILDIRDEAEPGPDESSQ